MNQKYKDKYEELRNNDLGAKHSNDDADQKEEETYATPGNVRNLGFVWEDGRKMFLNYAYLVSTELETDEEVNILTITFTSHVVKIRGYKLNELYENIFVQQTRIVTKANNRYKRTLENEIGITEILAIPNNK